MVHLNPERLEALGPAEHVLQTLTRPVDHAVHNRPGMVTPAPDTALGVRWQPVTWKEENGDRVVYGIERAGRGTRQRRLGVLQEDGRVLDGEREVGEYRKPGLFPEVVAYLYRKVAEVWRLDNEFAARLASWSFAQDYRDLKVILAAFMLVQSRSGEPVREHGEIIFHDEDYRAIGEAMCLLRGKHDLNPKLLLRVGEVLELDEVAAINRELGFGRSGRNPAYGRYHKAVEKWLRHREQNPAMLEGLVKAGFRTTVMRLCRKVGYRPESPRFFEVLRWKQTQAQDGRRTMAIGDEVAAAETWEGLSEVEICTRIMSERPGYKRIIGMLPAELGLTRAVMAAAIEAGSLSDADLIILTPTIEELGLLEVEAIKTRWQLAMTRAENQRAANIARRVRKAETAEALQEAADTATRKALEEVTRNLRVYVVVDKSGSMQQSLARAKLYLTRMLQGFPPERLHISVFNTVGTEITLKSPTAAGVEFAFRGHNAGGGTYYAAGVRALAHHKPEPGEDALFLFVGDEGEYNCDLLVRSFASAGIEPAAFGLLKVPGQNGSIVRDAAAAMGIPCFPIDEEMFDDPYAVTRTLSHLIASTPVQAANMGAGVPRKTLVEIILETRLLEKPVWA
jgi:hypothetical protein